jgi:hypothetical protein
MIKNWWGKLSLKSKLQLPSCGEVYAAAFGGFEQDGGAVQSVAGATRCTAGHNRRVFCDHAESTQTGWRVSW